MESTAIRNPQGKEAEGKGSGRAETVESVMRIQMIPRTLVDACVTSTTS